MDGQHPHDFFMELAALYDYKLGEHTLLSFYAAPMGDHAMGRWHTLIALRRPKIRWCRSDTIFKTPPTSRPTWSR